MRSTLLYRKCGIVLYSFIFLSFVHCGVPKKCMVSEDGTSSNCSLAPSNQPNIGNRGNGSNGTGSTSGVGNGSGTGLNLGDSGPVRVGDRCASYVRFVICPNALQGVVAQNFSRCRDQVFRLCETNGQPVKGEQFCVIEPGKNSGYPTEFESVLVGCDPVPER